MFYSTKENNHNLKYNPFKACVVPRPIAWISTLNEDSSVNLGPYSYFNAVSDLPPMVMFSSSPGADGEKKDSIRNIEREGEFVLNMCSFDNKEKMQLSSSPLSYGQSEAETFDIAMDNSYFVKTPRIKNAKITLECKYVQTIDLTEDSTGYIVSSACKIVIGHVVGIYIDDNIIKDGMIDTQKLQIISRLGYSEYGLIDNIFTLSKNKG